MNPLWQVVAPTHVAAPSHVAVLQVVASTHVGVLSHVADQLQVAWPLHVAQSPHVAVWQVGERQVTVPEHVVQPWHEGSFQQVGAQSSGRSGPRTPRSKFNADPR